MKAFLQNVVDSIRQGGGFVSSKRSNGVSDTLISAYSIDSDSELDKPSPARLNRKPAGILYADIADYTRLTERDEEGTHLRLIEAIRVMMSHVAANGGRIAHLAGDAVLAEFRNADSALHCAINVQLAARHWNAGLDYENQVLFRIGVNFGEVIADNGDIYGNAVNLASRLEKLASTGGICVSEAVRKELADHPSIRFVAAGSQYVKNLSEPVEAFWIEVDAQQIEDAGLTCAARVSEVTP